VRSTAFFLGIGNAPSSILAATYLDWNKVHYSRFTTINAGGKWRKWTHSQICTAGSI